MLRLLILMYGVVALASYTCRPSRDASHAGTGQSQTTGLADSGIAQAPMPGLYWAVSAGGRAWLFYLDPGSTASAVYRALGPVAICEVITTSSGSLVFHSAEMTDGTTYRFVGQLSRDGVAGTLERVRVRTGAVTRSYDLVLKAARAGFVTGAADPLSGQYSDLRASDASGDVYGTEVVLVDGVDGVVGLSVDYEGGPGTPRALTGERVGDALHIAWQYPDRVKTDTGLIRGDTLTFFGGRLRLVKRLSLPELSGGPTRSECR